MCCLPFKSSVYCITNNPKVADAAECVVFVRGTGRDVLIRARDEVHRGCSLMSHPFYGNFMPNQQPYRTVVMRTGSGAPDAHSIEIVERALAVYEAYIDRLPVPGDARCDADYGYIDFELIRESLAVSSLLRR